VQSLHSWLGITKLWAALHLLKLVKLMLLSKLHEGTRWRSWLRHCATSRQVAGSIPDGVIGIFHGYNPSGRTVALGLTLLLTEMNNRNISWGKADGAWG